MKTTTRILLFALFLSAFFSCQSPSAGDTNANVAINGVVAESQTPHIESRYGIESGIIHKKIINSLIKGENTIPVWFDQYVALEVSENYTKMEMMGYKIEESTWSFLQDRTKKWHQIQFTSNL